MIDSENHGLVNLDRKVFDTPINSHEAKILRGKSFCICRALFFKI
jgi:hypothetical protein